MNNGYSTGYFDLERGTREGDPLSAYLFILVFEILLIQIRQDNEVTGFTVDGSDVKLTSFANEYLQKAKHRNNKLGRNLHFNKENHS